MPQNEFSRSRPPVRSSGSAHSSSGAPGTVRARSTTMVLSANEAWNASSRSTGSDSSSAGRRPHAVQVHHEVGRTVHHAAGLVEPGAHAGHHFGRQGDVEGGTGNRNEADVQRWFHGWVPCR